MERRLTAILATDVVGYSRMIRADEEGTLAALKALRSDVIDPKIAEHHGRIVKLMGDGMLAEFPSVVDAVRAAVATQQAVREHNSGLTEDKRIEFRVGINLGDVVIDGDDIQGDGVNMAARLEALAKPGGVCISGSVHEQVRDRIDIPFEDLGEQKVKNIDRPVRVWQWIADAGLAASVSAKTDEPLPLPDKPSIAVLPFENMSGDVEQEYFADGMSEDIITGLSRYRSLFVIARNSAFAYKGQSPDLRDVARDLGVKYVLEGSIRKAGARIRVTGQLIEGATGNHIWAERYDRDLTDIFAVQDEITEAIVAAIGPEIDQIERERAQRLPPDNLDIWESYQRGLWHLYRFNLDDNAEAQRLFKRAITHAPHFSPAHSALTHALYFAFMHGYGDDTAVVLNEALGAGRDAVAADERDAEGHFALGRILYLRREHDASIAEFETAVAYNPSLAHAHLGLGTALVYSGFWDRAIESLDRAQRLSPHDPLLWIINTVRVMALLGTRRLEEAEAAARLSTRQPTAAVTAYFILAATLGQLGKQAEAADAMADVLAMKPDIDAGYISQILPFKNPDDLAYIIEGLHKAGMPR